MIQSIFVYGIMIGISVICSYLYAYKYKGYTYAMPMLLNPLIALIIITYVFFCAVRYDVGVDYPSYFDAFTSAYRFSNADFIPSFEPLFCWLTWFLAKIGIPFQIYFGIIAFIQISLVISAFKHYPKLLPYVLLVLYICGYFIDFQNILRQNIIVILFLFVSLRCRDVKFWKYLCIIFLCSFIHRSSFVMLPCYFLLKWNNPIRVSRWILIAILCVCAFFGVKFNNVEALWNNPLFISMLEGADYSYYLNDDKMYMGMGNSIGLGFLLKVFIDAMVVFYLPRLTKNSNINGFNALFRIFYIGLCIKYMFPTSMLISRPLLYFTIFGLVIYPSFIYCMLSNVRNTYSINRAAGYIFIIGYTFLFITSAFINPDGNAYEYHFYWEYDRLLASNFINDNILHLPLGNVTST